MKILDLLTESPEGELQPKLDKGQRILLAGRSGSGKDNAANSFPKDLYVFDADNRIKGGISSLKWLGKEEFSKISFDYYNPKDGFEALDNKLNEIANAIEARQSKIKTIHFASVGSLVYMLALDSQRKRGTDHSFKGKVRGKVEFLHPDDYSYVSTAFRLMAFNYWMPLNEMGVNVILSAWITDKWGKKPGTSEYAPSEVTGEKIVGPGNLTEEVIGYFDEMYYFRRKPTIPGVNPKFTVEFNGSFAKTALGLPAGEFEVTDKNFYTLWSSLVPSFKEDKK